MTHACQLLRVYKVPINQCTGLSFKIASVCSKMCCVQRSLLDIVGVLLMGNFCILVWWSKYRICIYGLHTMYIYSLAQLYTQVLYCS